jgi:hypothetical protein
MRKQLDPPDAATSIFQGQITLGEALGFTAEDRAELRTTAYALLVSGQRERAKEAIDVLFALGDDHPLTAFLEAEMRAQDGDRNGALAVLKQAIDDARAAGLDEIASDAAHHQAELSCRSKPSST